MKRERGFSLLEVIIAIALIGIVAVAIYAGLATATKTVIITDERATAESLARTQMEAMKKIAYNNTSGVEASYLNAKITPPSGYEISSMKADGSWDNKTSTNIIAVAWNATTSPPPPPDDAGLQRIKLVIYHLGKSLFTLEDYKVDR